MCSHIASPQLLFAFFWNWLYAQITGAISLERQRRSSPVEIALAGAARLIPARVSYFKLLVLLSAIRLVGESVSDSIAPA